MAVRSMINPRLTKSNKNTRQEILQVYNVNQSEWVCVCVRVHASVHTHTLCKQPDDNLPRLKEFNSRRWWPRDCQSNRKCRIAEARVTGSNGFTGVYVCLSHCSLGSTLFFSSPFFFRHSDNAIVIYISTASICLGRSITAHACTSVGPSTKSFKTRAWR